MNNEREVVDRRTVLGATGSAVAAALGGCTISIGGPETKEVDGTYDAGDVERVVVESVSGDVSVTGTDRDDVRVDATIEETDPRGLLDDTDIDVSVEDRTLSVAGAYDGFDPENASLSVNFDVEIPADLPLERAASRNGAIDVEGTTGDATLETSNGTVDVTDVDGYLTLETTNGSVTTRDVVGVASADTTNGSVDVELRELRDDVTLSSTNGSVSAAVPADLDAEVRLDTTNGDADVGDLELSNVESPNDWEIAGRLGDGGPTLSLETTNGDVSLEQLS